LTNYRTWARLTLKGKETWGAVFFDDLVPIKPIAAQRVIFDARSDPESVFSMDWTRLTEGQQQIIIEKISQNPRTKEEILFEIAQSSVPLPRTHVQCLGVDDKTFFVGEPLNDSIQ
jgi:hypothetical protein